MAILKWLLIDCRGLFYLVAYAVTNFGAWGVVIALEKSEGEVWRLPITQVLRVSILLLPLP